ncbi:adenylate/guanylate cyclase domain-containing protein [Herpetosiphon sp. NSE202]|uniref:adenylate/guanylate cyclase domain-containing protein n=1 Tax=Herpetosiphon sp. NSE202 TaxID=3351349 RepID=UPI0036326FE5
MMALKPFRLGQSMIVPLPLADVWEIAAQTSQINHAVGLPPITYSERTRSDGVREMVGNARQYGLPVQWVEHPFEWVYQQQLWVERVFEHFPPLDRLIGGTILRPHTSISTEVETFVQVFPKNLLGYPIGWFIATQMIVGQAAFFRSVAKKPNASNYFPPARKVRVNRTVLQELRNRMRDLPCDQQLIDRLFQLIQTQRDEDVATMRPFVLADAWGAERLSVLRVFLYATWTGLLDMNWDVLCPNCRVAREPTPHLRDLTASAHCEVCNINYDVNFDEYVELRFSVSPKVRSASGTTFCALGSPALNEHIVAQARLKPNEQREVTVQLSSGGYRMRMLGIEQRCTIQAEPAGATSANITLTNNGPDQTELNLATEAVVLSLHNTTEHEQLLIIEHDAWGFGRVSASLVSTLAEFRSLFSSEVLAPGLGLGIKNLTILFSDIKNSTPMYEEHGDSLAYAMVRDHFSVLFQAIEQHNGSIVKTIGDAVMAVFANPADGVAAALAIHQNMQQANQARPDRPPIVIKIGLHTGTCIAVNANEVLDYFGTTVNAAARAQGLSVGDDVILTADVMESAGVRAMLSQHNLLNEHFTHNLKGISHIFTLYRLTPNRG